MKIDQILEDQEFLPRMKGDATAQRLAGQLVRTAIKNFDDKDELPAAKKMARGFYQNLLKHIETEYKHAKMKKVDQPSE